MNKVMKSMIGVMAVTGMGYGAWMMYKKKNPTSASELKNNMKKVWNKSVDMIENDMNM